MRSSKGLLEKRDGRLVHDAPEIEDPQGKILKYFEVRDSEILSDLLWDTILIKDYAAFIERAQLLIKAIDDLKLEHHFSFSDEPYLLDLYLQLNENIDYYALSHADHLLRKEARQKNRQALSGPGFENSWEYYLEDFFFWTASMEMHENNHRTQLFHATEAIKSIEKFQQLKGYSTWGLLRLFEMKSNAAFSQSRVAGLNDPSQFSLQSILVGLYYEKASLIENRIIRGEKALESEADEKKQTIFRKWFAIYSNIMEYGKMASGINRRLVDTLSRYSENTHDMDMDDRIIVNEAIYSIKKGFGYYKDQMFREREETALVHEDPVEYVKDVYLIRGFLEEKSLLRKDLIMGFKDIQIRIRKVKSVDEIFKKLRTHKGKKDFFYYFVIDQSLDESTVDEIINGFVQKEKEIEWPGVFRLVYQIEPGRYGCPEMFKGMV